MRRYGVVAPHLPYITLHNDAPACSISLASQVDIGSVCRSGIPDFITPRTLRLLVTRPGHARDAATPGARNGRRLQVISQHGGSK